MDTYITPIRDAVIGGRVTAADRALLKAAAAAKQTTLSKFVAEAATRAARWELRLQGERPSPTRLPLP